MFVALLAVPAFAEEWKEVGNETFTAVLPGDPKVQDDAVETAAGKMKTRTWASQKANAYYAISMVSYPPDLVHKSIPSKMLEGARDGALANIQATLEKDYGVFIDSGIPKKKWPGRELFANAPQGMRYAARLYLVDAELYQIIVVRKASEGSDDDFKKIVESFKLKPPPGAAPAPAKKK